MALNKLLDQSIKSWYTSAFPDDEVGQNINEQVRFSDALMCLLTRIDDNDLISAGDTVIRERIFEELENRCKKLRYNDFYQMWLYPDNIHSYARLKRLIKNA